MKTCEDCKWWDSCAWKNEYYDLFIVCKDYEEEPTEGEEKPTMKNYYDTIPDFKLYVDKYAISNNITVDEALTHAMVKNYLEWYLYINKNL